MDAIMKASVLLFYKFISVDQIKRLTKSLISIYLTHHCPVLDTLINIIKNGFSLKSFIGLQCLQTVCSRAYGVIDIFFCLGGFITI
jgi:hypothetical protein